MRKRNKLFFFQILAVIASTLYNFCDSLVTEQTDSIRKVEQTLELILDFIRKTKDSSVYNMFALKDSNKKIEGPKRNSDNSKIRGNSCLFKPSNCADIQLMGFHDNGIYEVYPRGQKEGISLKVYCDLTTDGGGWIVFQRRGKFPGEHEDFFRNWDDYKKGFGDLNKEFWLGNEYLSLLTIQDRMIMRVDLEDYEGNIGYAEYSNFLIEPEDALYNMTFSLYNGNAGDSLAHHNGYPFATQDKDNESECAKQWKGGWWYNNCHDSNLNGVYFQEEDEPNETCTNWYHLKNDDRCMEKSEMKLRPMYFDLQVEDNGI